VTLENTDSGSTTRTLEVGAGALGNDAISLTLSGGETVTETFTFSTSDGDAGTYTVVAESGKNSDSTSVDVLEAAKCNVNITSYNSPVTAGNALEVGAKITNTGEVDTDCQANLSAGSLGTSSKTVPVGRGETTSELFQIQTDSSDAGTYTAEVTTSDDRESESIEVTAPSVSVSANSDTVAVGEQAEVQISAANSDRIVVSQLWTDWTVDVDAPDDMINNSVAREGELILTWGSTQNSVSPLLTISLPTRYIGGEYVVEVVASNSYGNDAKTEITLTIE
jgi:hypothetical protein